MQELPAEREFLPVVRTVFAFQRAKSDTACSSRYARQHGWHTVLIVLISFGNLVFSFFIDR